MSNAMPTTVVTYLDHNAVLAFFAQYCGSQAGWYRDTPRAARREAEIAAHAAGVRVAGRYERATY